MGKTICSGGRERFEVSGVIFSKDVRVVYVTNDGAEFPINYCDGEMVSATIRVQRQDGSIETAVRQ